MAGVDIFPQGHSDDIYRRYGNRIFNFSAIGANAIRKARAGGTVSDEAWVSILFELLFFYVALTGEVGLEESDRERRARVLKKFSELVIPAAVDFLLDDGREDGNADLKARMLSECLDRTRIYQNASRFLPEDGTDGKKGTALSILCARVSDLAGDAGETALVVTCQSHVMDSLKLLNMDVFAALAGK